MLNIINRHCYKLLSFRSDSKKIFTLVLENVTEQKGEKTLSIMFCNEEEIITLNKKYRYLEKKSDVLSFCSDSKLTPDYLGDIVICYPLATKQAIKYQHSLKRELSFLFLHGLLHLLGYNHLKLTDEIIMFDLQRKILKKLEITRKN